MKVLMVCLGNICRSPMAEGILQHKVDQAGLNVEVDGCGTGGWHAGESPDGRAQSTMAANGIDISGLRARQFSKSDFANFDVIYTMDDSNYHDIIALADSTEDELKVRMILNESDPNSNTPVPDPYYGGHDGFESVFQLLDAACDKIVAQLK
jgi:protein-tyrosine phosphatase